jgi:PIN domain nuclease of toxin-antitoxin system
VRVLLDTQALLWAAAGDRRLSKRATQAIQKHELWLSVASVWEIMIKCASGKLRLAGGPSRFLEDRIQESNLSILPIQFLHVLELERLPDHHNDPFDRLLVCQSRVEDMPIVSSDPAVAKYDVKIIW